MITPWPTSMVAIGSPLTASRRATRSPWFSAIQTEPKPADTAIGEVQPGVDRRGVDASGFGRPAGGPGLSGEGGDPGPVEAVLVDALAGGGEVTGGGGLVDGRQRGVDAGLALGEGGGQPGGRPSIWEIGVPSARTVRMAWTNVVCGGVGVCTRIVERDQCSAPWAQAVVTASRTPLTRRWPPKPPMMPAPVRARLSAGRRSLGSQSASSRPSRSDRHRCRRHLHTRRAAAPARGRRRSTASEALVDCRVDAGARRPPPIGYAGVGARRRGPRAKPGPVLDRDRRAARTSSSVMVCIPLPRCHGPSGHRPPHRRSCAPDVSRRYPLYPSGIPELTGVGGAWTLCDVGGSCCSDRCRSTAGRCVSVATGSP